MALTAVRGPIPIQDPATARGCRSHRQHRLLQQIVLHGRVQHRLRFRRVLLRPGYLLCDLGLHLPLGCFSTQTNMPCASAQSMHHVNCICTLHVLFFDTALVCQPAQMHACNGFLLGWTYLLYSQKQCNKTVKDFFVATEHEAILLTVVNRQRLGACSWVQVPLAAWLSAAERAVRLSAARTMTRTTSAACLFRRPPQQRSRRRRHTLPRPWLPPIRRRHRCRGHHRHPWARCCRGRRPRLLLLRCRHVSLRPSSMYDETIVRVRVRITYSVCDAAAASHSPSYENARVYNCMLLSAARPLPHPHTLAV